MDLKISKKKVVMTTFIKSSAVGIIIVDPEIIKNYQFLFDFLWAYASSADYARAK